MTATPAAIRPDRLILLAMAATAFLRKNPDKGCPDCSAVGGRHTDECRLLSIARQGDDWTPAQIEAVIKPGPVPTDLQPHLALLLPAKPTGGVAC